MKRILLLAALLGFVSTSGSAFAYNFVSRTIPAMEDASGAQTAPAAPQMGVAENPYDIGSFEAEEEDFHKLFTGSIVGSWQDGYGHEGANWNMNQVWLSSEREVDPNRGGLDYGYRVDGVFGTNILQSADGFDGKWGVSNDGYGASLYQAYGQLGYGKLSLKAGKFGTTIGYESVDCSQNDFVTHTHMFDHEPTTHTGGLFTFQLADTFSLDFGLVSGIDNSFDNRRGDTGFLFGANLDLAENVSVSYAGELSQIHSVYGENRLGTAYGYYDIGGLMVGDSDEYLQTITANIDFTDRLSYAFTTNYGTMQDRATRNSRYGQLGFANYLTYMLTDQLKAGVRYEYYTQWLDEAGRLPDLTESRQNCHDVSFALTYKPIEFLFIQPEVRYDWIETGNVKDKITDKEDGVTGSVACGITF